MNTESQALAIGIDLGTTNSVLATINELGRPATVPNFEGELLTPSVVLLEESVAIVGRDAVKALGTDYARIARSPKRQVGKRIFDKEIGGRRYPPEAFQGWILRKLLDDAEQKLGKIEMAVVTVPAYFDEVRRKSTQDAGHIAGIDVIDIINEPTAAAIAYGVKEGFLDNQASTTEPVKILVYDLGGGTFDVTVMEIKGNQFNTLATDGDYLLGGDDWDTRIIDFVAENFIRLYGIDPRDDDESVGLLIRDARDAKESLTSREQTTIACTCQSQTCKTSLTRTQFEELTIDLVERTSFTTRQTLQAASLEWQDIDQILLVGGSTRMPMIREMLEELSGRPPNTSLSPDEAVAHGAAVRAQILLDKNSGVGGPKPRIRNVNSHTLGVVALDVETREPRVVPLIPRNTPLPVVAKQVFKTRREGQESILVKIVEGESANPENCSEVGRCSIWDIPDNLPVGSEIEVQFGYRENGRLKVTVQVEGHPKPFTQKINRPNSLTPQQLDSWRKYIAKI